MRMIEVEYNFVFCYFTYICIKLMTFCIVQHNDVSWENVFAVEVSVRITEHFL